MFRHVRYGFLFLLVGLIGVSSFRTEAQQSLPTSTATPTGNQSIYWFDWSDDGSRLAVLSDVLYIYDREFHLVISRPVAKAVVSLSPDGTLLAVENEIWSTDSLKPLFQLQSAYILGDWSADRGLISGVAPKLDGIVIYDTHTGKLVKTVQIEGIQLGFNPLWSPDGRYFAATHRRNTVVVIDSNNQQKPKRYLQQENASPAIAWSHEGTQLAFTGWAIVPPNTPGSHILPSGDTVRDSVYIMDALTGNILKTFTGLPYGEREMIWSPDDQQLLTTDGGASIFIWNVQSGKLEASYHVLGSILGVNYSPFGGQVMVGLDLSFVSSANRSKIFTESVFSQSFLNGAIQIFVPTPSLEKLQTITKACGMQSNIQQSLVSLIDANGLTTFTAQVSDLTDAQIPAGCKADLLAVAEALMAQSQ